VARIKSAAFLKASANLVSFYSAKENLKDPFFRPFRKEVYPTPFFKFGIRTTYWWKHLTNSARDSCHPYLIFKRCIPVLLSFQLTMNWLMNLLVKS